MKSIKRKIELANEMMKKVQPIYRTPYSICVYGYGPFDDGEDDYMYDDNYLDMVHGRND